MKLVKANPAAKVTGADELLGKSNYFIGNDPKKWRTNLTNYAKVKYEGIYSGVDLVYYGNQRQLEYDFVVAPGADPHRIQFDVRGSKHISRDKSAWLAKRNTEHGSGLGRWRWVVERTFAWLNQFRRLRVRYEKRAEIHEAFLALVCSLICWRFLEG
jgi:hypothetical protein